MEITQRIMESLFGSTVEAVAAPKIGIVSLRICGLMALRMAACFDGPTRLDFLRDSRGYVVLQRNDVLRAAVVFLRPEVTLVFHLNELCGDAQPVSVAPDAALKNILHVEFTADLVQPLVAVLVSHNRGSRDHPQAFRDRKSTRLNSSHLGISYAVFCL